MCNSGGAGDNLKSRVSWTSCANDLRHMGPWKNHSLVSMSRPISPQWMIYQRKTSLSQTHNDPPSSAKLGCEIWKRIYRKGSKCGFYNMFPCSRIYFHEDGGTRLPHPLNCQIPLLLLLFPDDHDHDHDVIMIMTMMLMIIMIMMTVVVI